MIGKNRKAPRAALTRRLVQVYAAVLYNAHVRGFAEGSIYTGPLKSACVPGLNCYSCPGAVAACPLGALQNAVAASASAGKPGFYVCGILLLFGLLFGRMICGFACPMGLLQELIYKIPLPGRRKKPKKNRLTRVLSGMKYVLLAGFVIILPLLYGLRKTPLPAFCKWICPAGTLGGALPLLLHPANGDLRALVGGTFLWKAVVLAAVLVLCVFVFRPFCRFLCPLGALYGLFAKIALLGVRIDRDKCIDCGACVKVCPVDTKAVGDRECVHCCRCVSVCAHGAISVKAGKITLLGPETAGRRAKGERA